MLTGPTNALSLALAASLAPLALAGSAEYLRLALVVTLMVGAIQLAVALLRLGVLTQLHRAVGAARIHHRRRAADRVVSGEGPGALRRSRSRGAAARSLR